MFYFYYPLFTSVKENILLVELAFCLQNNQKIYGPIVMKFSGNVDNDRRTR